MLPEQQFVREMQDHSHVFGPGGGSFTIPSNGKRIWMQIQNDPRTSKGPMTLTFIGPDSTKNFAFLVLAVGQGFLIDRHTYHDGAVGVTAIAQGFLYAAENQYRRVG